MDEPTWEEASFENTENQSKANHLGPGRKKSKAHLHLLSRISGYFGVVVYVTLY